MGLFGKTEYERQLEISARQLAEMDRQMEKFKAQQDQAQENLDDYKKRAAITVHQQQETAALQALEKQNLERQAKLLDHWEDQARRFDALLTKWEQTK